VVPHHPVTGRTTRQDGVLLPEPAARGRLATPGGAADATDMEQRACGRASVVGSRRRRGAGGVGVRCCGAGNGQAGSRAIGAAVNAESPLDSNGLFGGSAARSLSGWGPSLVGGLPLRGGPVQCILGHYAASRKRRNYGSPPRSLSDSLRPRPRLAAQTAWPCRRLRARAQPCRSAAWARPSWDRRHRTN
jgi:hypothetical protein